VLYLAREEEGEKKNIRKFPCHAVQAGRKGSLAHVPRLDTSQEGGPFKGRKESRLATFSRRKEREKRERVLLWRSSTAKDQRDPQPRSHEKESYLSPKEKKEKKRACLPAIEGPATREVLEGAACLSDRRQERSFAYRRPRSRKTKTIMFSNRRRS